METTSTQTRTFVRRGNGSAVHIAVTMDVHGETRIIGTRCALDVRAMSRQHLHITVTDGPATCRSCLGPDFDPTAEVTVPEQCARHNRGVYEVKTFKKGTRTTYTCGCAVWS